MATTLKNGLLAQFNAFSTSSEASENGLFAQFNAQEERKLIDKLRDIGLGQYIELPQVAVMGDTSSGKSSLLSALSGVSFPSSHSITTRCPTQLILTRADTFHGTVRLVRFQSGTGENEDSEDKKDLNRLEDVPNAITKLTKKLIAEGQYISDDTIVIEMSGPNLPNLTLTDLPGLVRTVSDNEDKSMILRVREMVNRYMKQERTVIIAVVPANVDMHNTEILQAAQEADPNGTRTVAVVTKLDLVDAGAEQAVYELLRNNKKYMKLGYHAVKCRGQRDLDNGTTIEKGVVNERAFFRQHKYWCQLEEELWGVPRLSERLVLILQDNIRRSLPKVISEINLLMASTQKSLDCLGPPLDSPGAQRQQFTKWVDQYLLLMNAAMSGKYEVFSSSRSRTKPLSSSQREVNVRLRAVLRAEETKLRVAIEGTKRQLISNKLPEEVAVEDAVEVKEGDQWCSRCVRLVKGTDIICHNCSRSWISMKDWRYNEHEELKKNIHENRGDELAIFPSYQVFCNLFRQCVEKWGQPTEKLLNSYGDQTKAVSDCVVGELHATSRVMQFINGKSAYVLERVVEAAKQEVNSLLHEECRPYTQDQRLFTELDQQRLKALQEHVKSGVCPDAQGRVRLADALKAVESAAPATEDREALEMKLALRTYLDVAVPRFVDEIPMRLNALVLGKFVDGMTHELGGLTDDKLSTLMRDSDRKVMERQRLKDKLSVVAKAKEEIEMIC